MGKKNLTKVIELINKYLKEIEAKYNLRILYACESGSRAWGFESHDSDYDVRFIFVQEEKEYLKITSALEHITFFAQDRKLDFHGWDLKKALSLVENSNPSLQEWIFSPIKYYHDDIFVGAFKECFLHFFKTERSFFHYYGLAKKMLSQFEGQEVKLKGLLYAYRAVLSAKWLMDKKTIPPVSFKEVLEVLSPTDIMKVHIYEMYVLKLDSLEGDKVSIPQESIEWMDSVIESGKTLLSKKKVFNCEKDKLNHFFYNTLKASDEYFRHKRERVIAF